MASIADRVVLDVAQRTGSAWPALALQAQQWLAERHLPLREAIVLLPFAQLLPPARRVFGVADGWQPQIATPQSLAASLGPPTVPARGQLSFDVAVDRLSAARLLREQPWAAGWARRDAQAFEQRVAALVDAAHEFARAAAAQSPAQREAWWTQARALLAPLGGPGGSERLLARVALEWAAVSAAPPTDRLFALRPSAWIAVRCGGANRLVDTLLAQAECPTLLLDMDPGDVDPIAAMARDAAVSMTLCDGAEEEAQSACALILAELSQRSTAAMPVALIAQDRVLTRRVRALLERRGVAVSDETGWKLSTTRAAAHVMALLRAATPQAGSDAVLDWLKCDALGRSAPDALGRIEAHWRRHAVRRRSAFDANALSPAAQALWAAAQQRLDPLSEAPRQSLADWLAALRDSLFADGNREALEGDAAGRQVIAALHLARAPAPGSAIDAAAREGRLTLQAFTAWVDAALEAASFLPPDEGNAQVVITPLSRAMLRPFAAAVLPGSDDKRLGAASAPDPLLPDGLRRQLGLPDAAQRREQETLAFAQLLRGASLHLTRRRRDGSEPLAASPLVERLDLALHRAGRSGIDPAQPRFAERALQAQPIARPLPSAAQSLPPSLSASAVEALRDCPYRFFATVLLGLREDGELEQALQKRDYGTWLHALLLRFHRARSVPRSAEEDIAQLRAAAREEQAASGLDEAELLPFVASFERLLPRYAQWLQRRDAEGWRFVDGEIERVAAWPELDGLVLRGRIDRIDEHGALQQLIDYKTGAATELARKVRDPLEDTQLAFYAALLRDGDKRPLHACYLALDGADAPKELAHADVADSAEALVHGLAADLRELRAGAALPALGEGAACSYCSARGLCRRDHWPDGEEAVL
jgi:ATP-dependent helicase/nuclease subunit B